MSVDATKWAWSLTVPPTRKLVLLSMADRAGETHACWPSVTRLEADTCLDRKTIMAAITDLEKLGLVSVERILGKGNCYQLVGVKSRETSAKNGTATSAKNGTGNDKPVPETAPVPFSAPVPKTVCHQSQKRDTHQSQKRDTESPIEPKGTGRGEITPLENPQIPELQPPASPPSMAGAICVALKSIGMGQVNPSHQTLKNLLSEGADIGMFVEYGRKCVAEKKPFAYLLAMVKGRMDDDLALACKALAENKPSAFSGGF